MDAVKKPCCCRQLACLTVSLPHQHQLQQSLLQPVRIFPSVMALKQGCCRFKYEVNGEAVGLGISGGVTALCLTLLTAAVTGGAAAQNTG